MNKNSTDPGGGRIRHRTLLDPKDLVIVKGVGEKKIGLHRAAAHAYKAMAAAAQRVGISLPLASGYRHNPQKEKNRWKNALKRYGTPKKARIWVAPPGRSAHRTGYALDIKLGAPINSKYVRQNRNQPAYKWLQKNAKKFGFYPYNKEPWHWEYNPPKSIKKQRINKYRPTRLASKLGPNEPLSSKYHWQFEPEIITRSRPKNNPLKIDPWSKKPIRLASEIGPNEPLSSKYHWQFEPEIITRSRPKNNNLGIHTSNLFNKTSLNYSGGSLHPSPFK